MSSSEPANIGRRSLVSLISLVFIAPPITSTPRRRSLPASGLPWSALPEPGTGAVGGFPLNGRSRSAPARGPRAGYVWLGETQLSAPPRQSARESSYSGTALRPPQIG